MRNRRKEDAGLMKTIIAILTGATLRETAVAKPAGYHKKTIRYFPQGSHLVCSTDFGRNCPVPSGSGAASDTGQGRHHGKEKAKH